MASRLQSGNAQESGSGCGGDHLINMLENKVLDKVLYYSVFGYRIDLRRQEQPTGFLGQLRHGSRAGGESPVRGRACRELPLPGQEGPAPAALRGVEVRDPAGRGAPLQNAERADHQHRPGESRIRGPVRVCPHLGCRVHWDSIKGEFICPCHNGHFDAGGKPISGPPADMGAALPEYKVIEDGDIVFLDLTEQV